MGEGGAQASVERGHGFCCDAHGKRTQQVHGPRQHMHLGQTQRKVGGERRVVDGAHDGVMLDQLGGHESGALLIIRAKVASDVLVVASADGEAVLERKSDRLRRRCASRLLYDVRGSYSG